MTGALQAFLKRPTTIVGIVTAVMFQLIFSVIWMTGYSGVAERIDRFHISIINEDEGQAGLVMASQLEESLPVQIDEAASLEQAKQLLDERKLQMVVRIPEGFTASLASQDAPAQLDYYVNESNPAMVKSMMTGISAQITAAANKQAIAGGAQALLGRLHMPEQEAASAASQLSERVVSNVEISNPVQGTNNQMVPMMMVLASYVGSMIMAMNFQQSALAVSGQIGRWHRFGARSLLNVAAAVIVSLVGSSLLYALGGQMTQGFLAVWSFQLLFVLCFMFVAQLFILWLGMAGMLLNIITLSTQLVTSGAMIPRELLPDFYGTLGQLLPATYAVEGSMDVLFGGTGVGSASLALLLILAVSALLSAGAVAIRKDPATRGAASS
ncbi:YhgE/Pip domain-containing protein [Paenibacillus sp. SYP-B4298]|uniref:YhgE/Pip domain-containing protein n=1 Tax=Paenibacillus sp. SYP-B4298 TaxID=2996034 RepID=UPI0022DDA7BE|nr:ABC transporter permease [Paenibacillus sp. SYP-B4298]